MDSVDLQVLATARAWAAAGHRLAWVTVVRTWGSAPRPPGSWLVVRDDGLVEGSVSGGCIEDDLVARMREGQVLSRQPFTLTYGVTQEEAARVGLPCGGTLELVVEPDPKPALLQELSERLARRQLTLKHVDLQRGTTALSDAPRGATLQWDGTHLHTVHGPQWRLLIIGAGQISRYLAQMALALDYEVTVCDPPDARSAVLPLTHDPKLDDMVLLEALKSPAFYVGAVGSRLNNERRKARLVEHFELTSEEIARLHGPVGLNIGSHTPPEIAVSIVAEMVAVRNGVWQQVHTQLHAAQASPTQPTGSTCAIG